MNLKQTEHLFFDLDHTLWDFDRNSGETMRELFASYLPSMNRLLDLEEFIRVYNEHNTRLWKRYRENKIDPMTLRRVRWHMTFRELKVETGDWVDQMGLDYLEISPRKPHLLPYTMECLETLQKRYPMHIITNGFNDVQVIKMACSGLDRFFKHMTTPEQARVKKPDPRIFLHALKAVGADPTRSLYIGDSYEADVLGARSAGLPVVFFNPRGADNPDGVPEIHDLRELVAMLPE